MISIELKSHFLRLYQIAFSDDNFDILEMQMLYKFAEKRGIAKEDLNQILLNPSHQTLIPETLELRIEYLYDLALMICVDNKITEDEINTLRKYCSKFGFLDENVNSITDFLIESAKNNLSKQEIIDKINS